MNGNQFKAAFATNDGVKISRHFGRAEYFEVIEMNEGSIIARERRTNTGAHHNHSSGHDHDSMHHEMHSERHNTMGEIVKDCDYVIAGGMGFPIFNFLNSLGKNVIITSLSNIDEALPQIANGTIENHKEKLH